MSEENIKQETSQAGNMTDPSTKLSEDARGRGRSRRNFRGSAGGVGTRSI